VKTQAPVINIKPYQTDEENAENIAQDIVASPPAKSKRVPATDVAGERIQKVLARGGVGSRREVERWIIEGRLLLNGIKVQLGDHLKAGDKLQLNGRHLKWEVFGVQPTRVLIYHKPTGEVVTRNDPQGRKVIFSQLPKILKGRWITVGRLDINTQGLLLVTNNGELANRLMHPSSEIDREYAVRILGEVTADNIAQLKKGIELEDGIAKFDDIQFNGGEGANSWYHVTVTEGRNRLVRRLWEALEFQVSRLMRVRYGPIFLPDGLGAGQCYELNTKELDDLLTFVKLPLERLENAVNSRVPQNKARVKKLRENNGSFAKKGKGAPDRRHHEKKDPFERTKRKPGPPRGRGR
jgi:23S rRNA pseudouridine2605 synthase